MGGTKHRPGTPGGFLHATVRRLRRGIAGDDRRRHLCRHVRPKLLVFGGAPAMPVALPELGDRGRVRRHSPAEVVLVSRHVERAVGPCGHHGSGSLSPANWAPRPVDVRRAPRAVPSGETRKRRLQLPAYACKLAPKHSCSAACGGTRARARSAVSMAGKHLRVGGVGCAARWMRAAAPCATAAPPERIANAPP